MSIEEKPSITELLTLHTKLADLEAKLATNGSAKDTLLETIKETKDSILPIRLQLNDFIHLISCVDDGKGTTTGNPAVDRSLYAQEKFNTIRIALLKLYNSIHMLSKNFEDLSPMFDTIPEYTVEHNTREFQPLESLGSINITSDHTLLDTSLTGVSNNKSITTAPIGTVNTPNSASLSAATMNTNINITNKKAKVSSNMSPGSTANTPIGTGTSASSAKKPRKPRQNKRSTSITSAKNTPKPTMGSNVPTPLPMNIPQQTPVQAMQSVQTPLSAITMNPTLSMPSQMINNGSGNIMSPNKVIGTPMAAMMARNPQQAQAQMQFNNNNQNPRNNTSSNTSNNTPTQATSQINMNTITPANILNMNLNTMNMPNTSTGNNGNNGNMNDFGNLDLNNIDLGSLNMEFL